MTTTIRGVRGDVLLGRVPGTRNGGRPVRSGDRVDSLWIDGERVPTGSWWLADGGDTRLMVPEPEPFLALIEDAQELRILIAEGRDATFTVIGFLSRRTSTTAAAIREFVERRERYVTGASLLP